MCGYESDIRGVDVECCSACLGVCGLRREERVDIEQVSAQSPELTRAIGREIGELNRMGWDGDGGQRKVT
jgi:hypothetical protein